MKVIINNYGNSPFRVSIVGNECVISIHNRTISKERKYETGLRRSLRGRPNGEFVKPVVERVKKNQFVDNYTKKLVNKALVGLIRSGFEGRRGRRSLKALVLDAENANTSRAVISCFGENSCLVDAPNLDDDISAMLNGMSCVESSCSPIGDYVSKWSKEYNVIFLDYCGTWRGNTSCNPIDDWAKVCSHIDDNDKPLVIGITICTRSNKSSSGEENGMTATNEIIQMVQNATYRQFNLFKIAYKHINTLFFQFGDYSNLSGYSSSLFIQEKNGEFTHHWDSEEKEEKQGLPYIRGVERKSELFKTFVE